MKIWPRTAAYAERLWSEPTMTWREAEPRFLRHRERLIMESRQMRCSHSGVFKTKENASLEGTFHEIVELLNYQDLKITQKLFMCLFVY